MSELIKVRESEHWEHVSHAVGVVGSEHLENAQQVRDVRHLVEMIMQVEGHREGEFYLGLVSGGCAGVDSIAEQMFEDAYEPYKIFEPTVRQWDVPGGFMERNKMIVKEADVIYVIRNRFTKRYGSGWTGDYAASLKKPVYRYYV